MMKKRLTAEQVQKVEKLLAKKIDTYTIADIIGCGQATVSRIKNKQHILQKQQEQQEQQEICKVKQQETRPQGTPADVGKKLDEIIELLHDLVKLWS